MSAIVHAIPKLIRKKLLTCTLQHFLCRKSVKPATESVVFKGNVRSSRPEVFCKKGVLTKFHKTHMKTPVPESLF